MDKCVPLLAARGAAMVYTQPGIRIQLLSSVMACVFRMPSKPWLLYRNICLLDITWQKCVLLSG